jgi:hypothetical protein
MPHRSQTPDELRRQLLAHGIPADEVQEWASAVDEGGDLHSRWIDLGIHDVVLLRNIAVWCHDRNLPPSTGLGWLVVLGPLKPNWLQPWVDAG